MSTIHISMSVPEEIRKIERPKGTVVEDERNGKYAVREKLSGGYYVDENGKCHRPSKNGKVVGHIINGVFVKKEIKDENTISTSEVDLKDWGNVEMYNRLNKHVLEYLKKFYNEEEALTIYIFAMLRACYKGISDHNLKRQYEETFLTEMFPKINFGKNKISKFLRDLGRCCSRITDFMSLMVNLVEEGSNIIIDGSLRQDHSRVNSLSEVSKNTSKLKHKEILLMYAYDMAKKQPICSKVYPGNTVDQRAVSDFISEFDIKSGTIVADKGFPPNSIKNAILSNKDLHYLLPIKNGSLVIDELNLYEFNDHLKGEKGIQCKKASTTSDGRETWYYSFRDPSIALEQELIYMSNHNNDFDAKDLLSRRSTFGAIVFESDLEMDSSKAYEIYNSRWLIELFFRSQEDIMEMDDTREESDYTVIGSNFINYLASIMHSRMLVYLDDRGLLDNETFGNLMNLLLRIKMVRNSRDDSWRPVRIAEVDVLNIEKIGLLKRPIVPKEVKKKGRPKGSKDKHPRKKRSDSLK